MSESLNLNYNNHLPQGAYKFTEINLNTIKPPETTPNFFHTNTGKIATKGAALIYAADTINNIPKNYTGCMQEIKQEYGPKGWESDITNLNVRGYCSVKTAVGDPFGMLKYGLDGQARLNHHMFEGKKQNFSLLSDADKHLSKFENKIEGKTLIKTINDSLHFKEKHDGHNLRDHHGPELEKPFGPVWIDPHGPELKKPLIHPRGLDHPVGPIHYHDNPGICPIDDITTLQSPGDMLNDSLKNHFPKMEDRMMEYWNTHHGTNHGSNLVDNFKH